jgi:hypothetical protein
MDSPNHAAPPLFIQPWTRFSIGVDNPLGTFVAAAWPAANRAIYIPIKTPCRVPVKRVWLFNGGTVSGNFDLGIFSLSGTKIFSTGSVAQAGVTTVQYATVDWLLPFGSFYLALSLDNATGQLQRSAALTLADQRAAGMLQSATSFPLPDLATFAAPASTYIPLFGVTTTDSGY